MAETTATAVHREGYDGACLDIESNAVSPGGNQTERRLALTEFTRLVRDEMQTFNASLAFATTVLPNVTNSKGSFPHMDLVALSGLVDFFFVMGYGTGDVVEGKPARSNSDYRVLMRGMEGCLLYTSPSPRDS